MVWLWWWGVEVPLLRNEPNRKLTNHGHRPQAQLRLHEVRKSHIVNSGLRSSFR